MRLANMKAELSKMKRPKVINAEAYHISLDDKVLNDINLQKCDF